MSILIAVAISATITLGLMTAMDNINLSQNFVELRSQGEVFNNELRNHLVDEAACTATLNGVPLTTGAVVPLPAIKNADGTDRSLVNQVYGDSTFAIGALDFVYLGDSAPSTTSGRGEIILHMNASRRVLASSTSRPRRIELRINREPAGALISCAALSGATGSLWTRSAADLDNIHYSRGWVGIGTEEPLSHLHLVNNNSPNQMNDDILLDSYSNSASPSLVVRRALGTRQSPGAVTGGAYLYSINVFGFEGSGFLETGSWAVFAESSYNSVQRPTAMAWRTYGADGNQERMRIASGGNVGIGVSHPTERLDLGNGSIKMGYAVRTASGSSPTLVASCLGNEQAIGGGCTCGNLNGSVNESRPDTADTKNWHCRCVDPSGGPSAVGSAYAICANIK